MNIHNMWNMKFLAKLGLWVAAILKLNICILACQKVLIKWDLSTWHVECSCISV